MHVRHQQTLARRADVGDRGGAFARGNFELMAAPARRRTNPAVTVTGLRHWILIVLTCGATHACAGKSASDGGGTAEDTGACVVGTVACECTPGGGCDPGLECRSSVCVEAEGVTSTSATGVDSTATSTETSLTSAATSFGDTTGGSSGSSGSSSETSGSSGAAVCGDGVVEGDETCEGVPVVCQEDCQNMLEPEIWLDASDAPTVVTVGVEVTQWLDKSANAYEMLPAGAGPEIGPLQNGLPTIAFDGTQGMIVAGTESAITGDFTAFAVVAATQASRNNTIFGKAAIARGNWTNDVDWAFATTTNDEFLINVTADAELGAQVLGGSWQVDAYHVLSAVFSGGTASLWVDGVFIGEDTENFALGTTHTFTVGGYGASERLLGNLAEVIAYGVALPDVQRQAVETHLMGKWVP